MPGLSIVGAMGRSGCIHLEAFQQSHHNSQLSASMVLLLSFSASGIMLGELSHSSLQNKAQQQQLFLSPQTTYYLVVHILPSSASIVVVLSTSSMIVELILSALSTILILLTLAALSALSYPQYLALTSNKNGDSAEVSSPTSILPAASSHQTVALLSSLS